MPSNSKGLNHLAAVCLLLTMAWGGWQVLSALRQGLDYPVSVSDFREGRSTQTLEKQIDLHLPARDGLIAAANAVRYKLLRSGGEQVVLGPADWLFLRDELRPYDGAASDQAARIALLAQAASVLERQGVHLLVLLVPDKARVAEANLPQAKLPHFTAHRYQEAVHALRAQGVWTVDLLGTLRAAYDPADAYYRSDTHWNIRGAGLAARAVADAVKQRGLSLPSTEFTSTQVGPLKERAGDLIRLMGLSNVGNAWRPQPDHEAATATRQISPDTPPAGGLLGDAAGPPVVLLGTSYSLRGNFEGQLQQALSAKVLNAAKDGGGFLQAATDYFKDDAFQSAKPLLVVWELPERMLPAPLANERTWLNEVRLVP